MRKTIKGLEREIEYLRKFEGMYQEEKRKYDMEFGKQYNFMLKNERRLYESHDTLVEIIKWLINPETTHPKEMIYTILKERLNENNGNNK